MPKVVEFWRSLADRLVCAECGASSWSISRHNYETVGRATCQQCGARAVYYRRGWSQPNAVAGAVTVDSLRFSENFIAESSNDWLAETAGQDGERR